MAEKRKAKAHDVKLETLLGDSERGKGKLTVNSAYAEDGTLPMANVEVAGQLSFRNEIGSCSAPSWRPCHRGSDELVA